MTYQEEIIAHYTTVWNNHPKVYLWDKGPIEKMSSNFRVLEFGPTSKRKMWTYATCCLSEKFNNDRIELHLFSNRQDEGLIELLTVVAYYHQNTRRINLNETINFGKPWQDDSACSYGFISLPYLDGPDLENLITRNNLPTKFYWLLPITENESKYKTAHGPEALEKLFDGPGFNYVNPKRPSLV